MQNKTVFDKRIYLLDKPLHQGHLCEVLKYPLCRQLIRDWNGASVSTLK